MESYDGKLVQYLDPDWAEVPELGTDGDEGGAESDGSVEGELSGNEAGLDEEGGDGDETEDVDGKRDLLTGCSIFALGSAQIEIMNYDPVDTDYSTYRVPDANRFSYAVLVTAANGRKAFLAGDIDDYSQGWSLGGGDETKNCPDLAQCRLLKNGPSWAPGVEHPWFPDRHYETDGKWGSPCCRADG